VSIFTSVDASRAWAEIDLDALTSNLGVVRSRIGPGTALLLVAKADAYGHGAVSVAHHALAAGVDALCVTTSEEARELLRAGIRARTVVLGPVFDEQASYAIRNGIEVCVPSRALAQAVEQVARGLARAARVHVKVDTGMGRLGMSPTEALDVLARIRASRDLELAGVMTHLAAVDGGRSPGAGLQLDVFERFLAAARERDLLAGRDVWVHAANSAAVLSGLGPRYDAVRVGIAAFGIAPDPSLATRELTPVLSVRTRVVHVGELARGRSVGYGSTWTARRPSRIAVLPVGYDDGVSWRLGNRGSVLLRGRRAPIVGRISMNYTSVDVTDIPGVELGERATLVGEDGAERIRVEELAELAGTVPYEITCSIGRRVSRTWLSDRSPSPTATLVT